jgi:hypothetical protein
MLRNKTVKNLEETFIAAGIDVSTVDTQNLRTNLDSRFFLWLGWFSAFSYFCEAARFHCDFLDDSLLEAANLTPRKHSQSKSSSDKRIKKAQDKTPRFQPRQPCDCSCRDLIYKNLFQSLVPAVGILK